MVGELRGSVAARLRAALAPGVPGLGAIAMGVVAVGVVVLGALASAAPAWTQGGAQTPDSVTTYHADAGRSAHYVAAGLTWAAAAQMRRDTGFDGAVPGNVYAQPLVWTPPGGRTLLIVTTEDDDVVALDADDGRVAWQRRLGTPVPAAVLPCSNIDPSGITGTPVIDPATGALYLDALVRAPAGPRHQMFGLDAATGAVLPGWPVDVGLAMAARGIEFPQPNQQQRSALALLGGRVFVGYGGFFGDCGRYHGIVMGFDTARPGLAAVWRTSGLKGGVWAPGGISVADEYLFFATGNTDLPEGAKQWDDGIGAFRVKPALEHRDDAENSFAPANYAQLDDDDLDLGGTVPVPLDLADGARRLIAMGKDGKAYLLDRDHLGGIGGALAVRAVSGGAIIQAPAVYRLGGQTMVALRTPFAICPGEGRPTAVVALSVTDRDVRTVWCAPVDGRGIPIVTTAGPDADPIVWVVGAEGDAKLHGYRGDNGEPVYGGEALPGVRHFVTPVVADGRMYVPGDGRIFAYRWDE